MRRALLGRAVGRETPTAVIDANLLRKPHVVRLRQERYRAHGEQIVIAGVVWSELVANADWESTLRASFREVAQEPEALVASWSVLAMTSDEQATGEPARRLVHPEMTAFVRRLVADVAADAPDTMSQLRAAVREHGVTEKPALAAQRKDATLRMVELSRRDISSERSHRLPVQQLPQGGNVRVGMRLRLRGGRQFEVRRRQVVPHLARAGEVGTSLRVGFEREPVDPAREATVVAVDPDVEVDRDLRRADPPLRDARP